MGRGRVASVGIGALLVIVMMGGWGCANFAGLPVSSSLLRLAALIKETSGLGQRGSAPEHWRSSNLRFGTRFVRDEQTCQSAGPLLRESRWTGSGSAKLKTRSVGNVSRKYRARSSPWRAER